MCQPPRLLKTICMKMKPENQSNKFQFLCMTLAIDITDRSGLSNEVRREFLPKKVMLYFLFILQ